ncbi:hypothetical protein DRO49_03620 [Candidatus Bathyarchaeota archaeon]|nr:MAG: hypothetical protein DRO49_03620 [Candidatus Bathyarchaeota archaeon]
MEKIKEIEKREFGFFVGSRENPVMVRKKRFRTQEDLENFIRTHNPLDCFVSVAYYDGGEWIGADLFFDLDSKENTTLARADAETIYEVLLDDFGLKEVTMNFSGSKGYHVIATDEVIRELTTRDRREICDYLIGKYKVETLDTKASIDVKRLRRIEGTINSKSGKLCSLIKSTVATKATAIAAAMTALLEEKIREQATDDLLDELDELSQPVRAGETAVEEGVNMEDEWRDFLSWLDDLIYKHIAEIEGVDKRGRYVYLLVKIISEDYGIDANTIQQRIEELIRENKLILYTDETGEYVRRKR